MDSGEQGEQFYPLPGAIVEWLGGEGGEAAWPP